MNRLIPLAFVLLILGTAQTAQAYYVGASYLRTDAEFSEAVDNFDTDDSSYKLYAGRSVSRFFSLEATYRDLGSHSDSAGTSKLVVDLEAYDLALKGAIPVGRRISLFARAGYANVSREGQLELSDVVGPIDDDDWDLTYGVGIEYQLNRFLGLRAEWEEYDVDDSLNSFAAGAFFRF